VKPKTKGKYTPNLDAFSNRKDVVYVITRFNAIEGRLAEILIKEIGAPEEKQAFLRDILFNSAILPFAAKVKLFLHLRVKKNWPKIDREVFRRLMEIRNQFAHSERSLEITVELLRERGKISSGRHVGNKMMLSSVTGSGELEKVDVADALAEFTQRWEVLSEYFTKLER
jgi:hypothetical protein